MHIIPTPFSFIKHQFQHKFQPKCTFLNIAHLSKVITVYKFIIMPPPQ